MGKKEGGDMRGGRILKIGLFLILFVAVSFSQSLFSLLGQVWAPQSTCEPPPEQAQPQQENLQTAVEKTSSPPKEKTELPPPATKAPDTTLVVEGPEWFRVQMLASLDLLRQMDPENYSFVLEYLDVIKPGERSEVDVLTRTFYRKPSGLRRPTILESWIFGAGKDYETIEEAAILVHEAAHVYLFEQGEKFGGKEGEAWAINRQLQCLERLGAPWWMKNELPLAYETHYWEVPREQRNW